MQYRRRSVMRDLAEIPLLRHCWPRFEATKRVKFCCTKSEPEPESADAGATVVCLLPSRTDTQWWHDHVLPFAEIRYLRGRIRFNGIENSAPFPSVIEVFRPPAEVYLNRGGPERA